MINTFIAAIVALFFWGKSSKEIEEKTELASWVKTCIYGVLSFLVLVFYVKTNQVATVNHTIQLFGLKETINANGDVADTIPTIEFSNSFSSNITENYSIFKREFSEADKLEKIAERGGLFMVLNVHGGPKYKLRKNPKIEREMKELYGFVPEITFGDYPLDTYSHAYTMNYMSSIIPSMIPFSPTYKLEKKSRLDNSGIYQEFKMGDCDSFGELITASIKIRDVVGNMYEARNQHLLHEMNVGNIVICDTITNLEDYHYKFHYDDNWSQKMNFFTAADISQYTCVINLKCDCYVERIKFKYDLPIEINPYDSCMMTSAYSFSLRGSFINKSIVNKGNMAFHVKFPTLANLQLIRSLILTTILVALSTLFLSNLFYLFRKYLIRFKEKHISQISIEKVNIFRKKIFILAFVIMIFVVYVSWRIYKERPFHFDIKTFDWLIFNFVWIILAILVLLCILVYFMFRKAYNIKMNKK